MTEVEAKKLLSEAVDLFFKSLGPELQGQLYPHPDDPSELIKPRCNIDQWHVRIRPTNSLPKRFWNAKWCFYEMGIGRNGGDRLETATCTFMWGPNQKSQGGGNYRESIDRVLKHAEEASNGDFRIRPVGETDATQMLCCSFRGYVKPGEMAAKMKWLIESTLKEIQAVPSL